MLAAVVAARDMVLSSNGVPQTRGLQHTMLGRNQPCRKERKHGKAAGEIHRDTSPDDPHFVNKAEKRRQGMRRPHGFGPGRAVGP